jgi:hypothetical protein
VAVLNTCKAAFDETSPLFAGVYLGVASSPVTRNAVEKSDCLLTVGLRRLDSTSAFFTDSIPASAIHLNARSVNLGVDNYQGVNLRELLEALVDRAKPDLGPATRSRLLPGSRRRFGPGGRTSPGRSGDGIGIGSGDGRPFSRRGCTHSSGRSKGRCHQVRKCDHRRQIPSDCQRHAGGTRASAPHPRNCSRQLTYAFGHYVFCRPQGMDCGRTGHQAKIDKNQGAKRDRSLPGQMLRRNSQASTGWGY